MSEEDKEKQSPDKEIPQPPPNIPVQEYAKMPNLVQQQTQGSGGDIKGEKKMYKAYQASSKILKEEMRQKAPSELKDIESVKESDIIIIEGTYDHGEVVFELAEIPYTVVSSHQFESEDVIQPDFESKFARLEYIGGNRFNLSYERHNGQWLELYADLTLDECLDAVRDDPWFQGV